MKRKWFCICILACFAAGLIACGDSDDEPEDSPAQTTTVPTTGPIDSPEEEVAEVIDVNFAAEQAKIEAFLAEYDAAVNLARRESDSDIIMEHWLEQRGIFMAHSLFGAVQLSRSFKEIKTSWTGIFKRQVHRAHLITVEELGIDARGEKATVSGKLQFLNQPLSIVLEVQKNDAGDWKLTAADYGNQGLIKRIVTPQ